MRILSRPPHPTLIQNNRWFHGLITVASRLSTVTRRAAKRAAVAHTSSTTTIGRGMSCWWYASSPSLEYRARSSART